MRATEFLSELFHPSKSLPIKWNSLTQATAQLPDGRMLIVNFRVVDPKQSNWSNQPWSIEFSVGGDFEMTGGGEVSTIFATVIEAVKYFTEGMKPKALYFTAEEKSRAKMYDTLAKRVSKQLGWHVVPHEEMIDDPKYQTPLSFGDFLFAIEPGAAPEHRQAAQKPQHGEFMPIYFVWSMEDPNAPVYKIKAKKSIDAEYWVRRHQPEYKTLDRMGINVGRNPPAGRQATDLGTVKYPPKPQPRVMNPLEKALHDKLNANEGADPLGQFIQAKVQAADAIEQMALKFSSAIDDDDEIGKIARGIMPAKTAPVVTPRAKPAPLPTQATSPKKVTPLTPPVAVKNIAPPQTVAKKSTPVVTQAGGVPWKSIAQYLQTRYKLDTAHIAGMLANIEHESGFNPATLVTDSNGLPSGGLFQHNGPRLQQLIAKLGNGWKQNWQGQLDFALSEPIGQKYVGTKFASPTHASHWWTTKWERPKNAGVQAVKRAKSVNKYR